MQLNIVEQALLSTIHNFPVEIQQQVLNYSLLLKRSLLENPPKNEINFAQNKIHNIIEELLNNPLSIDGDATPFNREEIYVSRKE